MLLPRTMATSRMRPLVLIVIMMSANLLSVDAFAPPATTSPLLQVERTAARHPQHAGRRQSRPKITSRNKSWPTATAASQQGKTSSRTRTGPLSSTPNYLDSLEARTAAKNVKDNFGKKLDKRLERLTTAFPLFVLASALVGYYLPRALMWVNQGDLVTAMLAAVMWGTGLTLRKRDFTKVWEKPANRVAIPVGVLCQFAIMPLTAYLVGNALLLPRVGAAVRPDKVQEALFLGLILVGSSPGGTASNLVSLIARANVALSVILTTCSTLAAVFMTPLLVKLLVGSTISISGLALCAATAKVVLLPVIAGMIFKARAPRSARSVARVTPFASVVLISLICGGVVAQTVPLLTETTAAVAGGLASANSAGILGFGSFSDTEVAIPRLAALSGLGYWTFMHPAIAPVILGGLLLSSSAEKGSVLASSSAVSLPLVLSSVLLLHLIGFVAGYMVPKTVSPEKEKTARTIAIEVGMQNSALAVVLARSIGAHPAASLPGALSATVHSCLGSILAAFWRMQRTTSGD